MSSTSDKVLALCSFLRHIKIMKSVRFHQAEEDRSTLQMHTSLLSFQCNNTCRAWWGGRHDGFVWENTHTCTHTRRSHMHIHSETNQINKTHVTSNMSHIPAFCSLLYCIPGFTQARSVFKEGCCLSPSRQSLIMLILWEGSSISVGYLLSTEWDSVPLYPQNKALRINSNILTTQQSIH